MFSDTNECVVSITRPATRFVKQKRKAFVTCGLHPLDANAVLSKLPDKEPDRIRNARELAALAELSSTAQSQPLTPTSTLGPESKTPHGSSALELGCSLPTAALPPETPANNIMVRNQYLQAQSFNSIEELQTLYTKLHRGALKFHATAVIAKVDVKQLSQKVKDQAKVKDIGLKGSKARFPMGGLVTTEEIIADAKLNQKRVQAAKQKTAENKKKIMLKALGLLPT